MFASLSKSAAMLALAVASLGAQAQHATTVTWLSPANDATTVTIRNDGPADIIGAELYSGERLRGRAIFNAAGTDGDLGHPYLSGSERYSVVTWEMDLQTGESATFALNVDEILWGDVVFLPSIVSLGAYAGLRITPLWADGFEAYIPMSHGLQPVAVFSYSDVAVSPVPEPGAALMMAAGLLLVGVTRRGVNAAA